MSKDEKARDFIQSNYYPEEEKYNSNDSMTFTSDELVENMKGFSASDVGFGKNKGIEYYHVDEVRKALNENRSSI